MKKKQITAAIPAVLLVLGLILAGCPQATGGGGGDDPIPPIPDDATAYTVKFEAYSGSPAPAQATIGKGKKVTEPGAMTKTGYRLAGWFKEATFANRWDFDTDTVSANITLYARWVPLQTSISAIESYIEAEVAAGRGGSASNPISIPAEIDFGSEWQDLLDVIAGKDKFVELDLTLCAMGGTEFDPDPTVSTGKDKIVKLVLPDAAQSIPAGTSSDPTFKHFTALTSVAGANIEEIGAYAFSYISSLTSASFPKATSIANNAFVDCTSLTSVSFPAAATLDKNPFSGCTSLSSFKLTGAGALSVIENGKALVQSNKLIAYPSASGTITIGSITSIGNNAFVDCAGLTSVSFPNVGAIGDNAFSRCANLTSVSFPEAISIGRGSFDACSHLASAIFPNVGAIGDNAFNICTGLTSLDISSVTSIGDYAFSNTGTGSLTITMGAEAPTVGDSLFDGVSDSKTVKVQFPSPGGSYDAAWQNEFKDGNEFISLRVEAL